MFGIQNHLMFGRTLMFGKSSFLPICSAILPNVWQFWHQKYSRRRSGCPSSCTFNAKNCQTFGKMAEHTAKTDILLITETQMSMPNLHSDECTAQVRPEPSARKPFRCITAGATTSIAIHSSCQFLKVTGAKLIPSLVLVRLNFKSYNSKVT